MSIQERQHKRRKVIGDGQGSASVQLMSLSLFIMLLAFFIILNAISTFEEDKVRPALESLEYAFSSKLVESKEAAKPSVQKSPEKSLHEGDTFEHLEAFFNTRIPGTKILIDRRRGIMYIRLPYDDLEAGVLAIEQGTSLQEDVETKGDDEGAETPVGEFLPVLAALLKTDETTSPYHMDMILNIEKNPAWLQNQEPQKIESYMKKMSFLAQKLEDGGIPIQLLSIGLQEGPKKTVDLFFKPHVPFDPLQGGKR